jgi:hypothetical protein
MSLEDRDLEQLVSVRMLPPQLRMLVRQIGFQAALKLVRERGGREISVPKTASADRVLAQVIGVRALEQLCAAYRNAGARFDLPKSDKILIQARNAAIIERRRAGASYPKIASEFGLTTRWVIEICNAARDADRQGDLFGSDRLRACVGDDSGAH